uniref:Uncharacterized protein n=1 Tax=Rhizophora mucronata TaxID=61149 RepID=A0A2P2Q3D3_RHIMU
MISNRNSPTRALKSVITALKSNGCEGSKVGQKSSDNASSLRPADDEVCDPQPESVLCREGIHTVRELRKLYGLLRMGSRRKDETLDQRSVDKEASRHGT